MKRRTTQGLATALLSGLAIIGPLLATSSAHATPFGPGYPKTGPHVGVGLSLLVNGEPYGTYLYDVDIGDAQGHLTAYCVDFHNNYHPGVPLQEAPWADLASLTTEGASINWAMHHSYPFLPLTEAETTSGLAFNGGLSAAEAIAATQAALWLFSDGIPLAGTDVRGTAAEQADVAAMYGYLTGAANTGLPTGAEPTLDLQIATTVGIAGTPIGPITVTTTSETVDINAVGFDGAILVDANGTPVGSATNGAEVYVDVPDEAVGGAVTVSATATSVAQVGRLFTPADASTPAATQLLAVAAVEETDVHAEIPVAWKPLPPAPTPPTPESPKPTPTPTPTETPASVTPPPPAPATQPVEVPQPIPPTPAPIAVPAQVAAPAPQPELAYTGLNATESLSIAAVLILGGIVLTAAGRRRRT